MSSFAVFVYVFVAIIGVIAAMWYIVARAVSIAIEYHVAGKFKGDLPYIVELALETLRGRIRFCGDHHAYVGEYKIFFIPIWFNADNARCVNYKTCADRVKQVLNDVNDMLITKQER